MTADTKPRDLNVRQQEKVRDKETSKQAIAVLVGEIDEAQEQQRNSTIPKVQIELSKAYHDEFMQDFTKYKIVSAIALFAISFFDVNIWSKSVLESDLLKAGFFIALAVVLFQNFSNVGYVTQILPNTKQKTKFEIERIAFVLFEKIETLKIKTFSFFTSALFALLIGTYFFTNSFIYGLLVHLVNFNIIVFYIFLFKTVFIKTQNKGK
ncbi:MAG: hypothetical protein RBR02_09600 [Desulfuromonadaceae bacterium]|nr:hypothetical protein [Desulfuromonadaceae bacterium]